MNNDKSEIEQDDEIEDDISNIIPPDWSLAY